MKLQGLKVVDLSVFLPGPYLSMALAHHGAGVIKGKCRMQLKSVSGYECH